MTASECVALASTSGSTFQRAVNVFIDGFREADRQEKLNLVAAPIEASGPMEGLVAAVVSALCREAGLEAPGWTDQVHSPEPFFAFPARSLALRLRLMIESPPAFRVRNVFVPENYLQRA
ncbi:MAG: hypothetical protein AB1486_29600 [Planctomycetota bacterium]